MGDGALLLTKIEPPHPRPGHVSRRPRLPAARGDARAPEPDRGAGRFRKTSLLAEWLTIEDEADVAWVSLDDDDNDPARFWAYVSAALSATRVDVPAAFEAAVAAPGTSAGDAACRC